MEHDLSVFVQNVRGLRSKCTEFKLNVTSSEFDLFFITETWLNSSVENSEIFESGYSVFRRDRETSASKKQDGGGVLIALRQEYQAVLHPDWQSEAEDIWVSIYTENRGKIHLCCVYLPPGDDNAFFCFTSNLYRLFNTVSSDTVLICGDFNMPEMLWVSKPDYSHLIPQNPARKYNDLLDTFGFYGIMQFNYITNTNNKILDLILCNKLFIKGLVTAQGLVKEDTYLKSLTFDLRCSIIKSLPYNQNTILNFSKANFDILNLEIGGIDWYTLFGCLNNVDQYVDMFYEQLLKITNICVPKIKINNKFPAYFSFKTIKFINLKNQQPKKWKQTKTPRDYQIFSNLRRVSKGLIRRDYSNYLTSIQNEIPNNCKKFWKFVSTKNKNSRIPNVLHLGNETAEGPNICNLFEKYFKSVFEPYKQTNFNYETHTISSVGKITTSENEVHDTLISLDENKGGGPDGLPSMFVKKCAKSLCVPLTLIFNKSLTDCTFPSRWKNAFVVPIFKGGDANCVSNYRPISKLNIFSKVFERIVHKYMINYIKQDIMLEQHGFLPKRSVETNLVEFVNFIQNAMDLQVQVDTVYTDFSKAFDKINHNILIFKLAKIGVHGDLLRWLTSYVFNRSLLVVVNGHRSTPFPATSGVPQGSLLGPLLFLIYLNDIGQCFKHCNFSLYADDLKVYLSVNSISDCLLLQNDLDRLFSYCLQNELSLNIEKCCFISFTRNLQIFKHNYSLNNIPLIQSYSMKDLGVVLDSKMTFSLHIDYIVSKANKMLGFILRQCRQFSSFTAMKMLYYSYVYSKLNYASVVWNPQYNVYKSRLEIVQNNFLRFLRFKESGIYSYTISTSLLRKNFKFFSLEARREQSDVIFLFKILNGIVDMPYFLSKIYFNTQQRTLRGRPLFCESFSRTNIGRNAPLNRMLSFYNMRYATCELFSISLNAFRTSVRVCYEID